MSDLCAEELSPDKARELFAQLKPQASHLSLPSPKIRGGNQHVIRAVFFDYDTVLSSSGALREGAEAFIRTCRTRFPLMLTAATSYAAAKASLAAIGLAPLFLDILTDAEVERRKPAPDLLLATLGRIGFLLRDRNPVEPGECLVVESTPEGIAAARAARMRSLAIAHSAPSTSLSSADFVCESFASVDLDEILRGCARLPPA